MSRQPQPQSRLLSLPRELRDEIYEYAFSQPVRVGPWYREQDPDVGPKILISNNVSDRNAGLPLACKQLHDETFWLYYELTPFIAYNTHSIVVWLEALAPEIIAGIGAIIFDEQEYWPSEEDVRRFLRRVLGKCSVWLQEGVLGVMVQEEFEGEARVVWI